MNIQLNNKPVRERYKVFEGSLISQMPKLIKDKRIPMTMKQIIERRLNSNQEDWKDNWFDTCDAVVQFSGKIKIVKSCELIRSINEKTKLGSGAIEITKQQYKRLKGKEFDKSLVDKSLTKEEALNHPIWKYLLGTHLKKYVELVFRDNETAMKIWLRDEELLLRAWFVYGTGNGSSAGGGNHLDYVGGRLVGVASEMLKEDLK